MGKRLRLNRFITKWIKSDLPQDCSSVLLLGVTRIPTSPLPARRPCSLPLNPSNFSQPESPLVRRNTDTNRRALVRRKSSLKRRVQDGSLTQPSNADVVLIEHESPCSSGSATPTPGSTVATFSNPCYSNDKSTDVVMDRSVDSIGTCSLDLEASVNAADWSEKSSTGTLLSASILSSTPEPYLPSYLSLACTVNGYSTITNYDPVRLSKSRDASPHRPNSEHLTQHHTVFNNLLSPPNLVPLPTQANQSSSNMTDQQFYTTSNRIESYCLKETMFSSKFISKDSVDACYDSQHDTVQEKFISSFENNVVKNSSQKQSYGSTITSEVCSNQETKSFIQQRVERLYGPGALAQGFFVMKRRQTRLSESEAKENGSSNDKHSKSMSDKLLDDSLEAPMIKQSASSPVLPVLRHLRPEFRAQLPIISPRRSTESSMPKSFTVPILREEINVNGLSRENGNIGNAPGLQIKIEEIVEESEVKDGHYFLKILDNETNRLLKLADECEKLLTIIPDLPEDAIGKIRSTFGKARLLVSQKMQQFKGLCTNNITQIEGEAFPTTNEDLQGFWDMVMLQVNQVDDLFQEIEKLKDNNWKEIEQEKPTKVTVNGSKPKRIVNRTTKNTVNSVEAQKQREAREAERKRLIEERRKVMRAKNSQQQNIEIFVPESS